MDVSNQRLNKRGELDRRISFLRSRHGFAEEWCTKSAGIRRQYHQCFIFPGALNPGGYGLVDVRLPYRRVRRTHVLVACLAFGDRRPEGFPMVCHHPIICNNPACGNPEHLGWGTAQSNSDDKLLAAQMGSDIELKEALIRVMQTNRLQYQREMQGLLHDARLERSDRAIKRRAPRFSPWLS